MKVVSFFAGCGGLDLGFEQAGFDVVWANELEPFVYSTYTRNHPSTQLVIGDIRDIHPTQIPECDGFIGGPPCQSWSIAGRQRGLEDKRGQLFPYYIDLIKIRKPKFFLIENVKGLLDNKFKEIFCQFLTELGNAGYDLKWRLLNAVDFKVPQTRERVFIIGFRKDLKVNFQFPTNISSTPISLREAIEDINVGIRKYHTDVVPEQTDSIPNNTVYAAPFGIFYNRGNRRRTWERPSFTIHATGENIPLHPGSPSMVFHGHENWKFQQDKMSLYRRLSVRECARIQTFPDNFILEGASILQQYRMLGNAVPPRLAKFLAFSIIDALKAAGCYSEPSIDGIKEKKEHILIGYFKNRNHLKLIRKNLMYYVRLDDCPKSTFGRESKICPKYILLHHKNDYHIFPLSEDAPIVYSAEHLNRLGFKTGGQEYLCFRILNDSPSERQLEKEWLRSLYNPYVYTPKIKEITIQDNQLL